MRDYFREFLIPDQPGLGSAPAPSAPNPVTTTTAKPRSSMTSKLLLGAGFLGVGAIAWQASKWHTIIKASSSDK